MFVLKSVNYLIIFEIYLFIQYSTGTPKGDTRRNMPKTSHSNMCVCRFDHKS